MLLISYQCPNQKQKTNASPLIVPIQPFLNQNVLQLLKICHQHFKNYLSPFIQKQNLHLISKKAEVLNKNFPLYMYINKKQFLQEIICTIKGIQQQESNKWRYVRNSLIAKFDHQSQNQVKIIPKEELVRINSLLSTKQSEIIINGKVMQIHQQGSQNQDKNLMFSKILDQNWQKFARQNDCVYLKN